MTTIFNRRGLLAALSAVGLLMAAPSTAHETHIHAGALSIEQPWARATPPAAKVGGGYLVITNTGETDDRLVSASADYAARVEIHEMSMVNDVMRMRPLKDGLTLPAGATVALQPGGFHIMLMGLKEPLVEGERRPLTLVFETAGAVTVDLTVESMRAREPGNAGSAAMDHGARGHGGHGGADHGTMKHGDMKHGSGDTN